jgi:hypothetical protein
MYDVLNRTFNSFNLLYYNLDNNSSGLDSVSLNIIRLSYNRASINPYQKQKPPLCTSKKIILTSNEQISSPRQHNKRDKIKYFDWLVVLKR